MYYPQEENIDDVVMVEVGIIKNYNPENHKKSHKGR